jgi:hypothetical protein
MSSLVPLICTLIPVLVLQLGTTLDLRAPWNGATCVTIIVVCLTCIQHTKTDVLYIDYVIGMTITSTAMDAIHMTLLVRPLHTFRHQEQPQPAHELPWSKRFIWAAQLCGSPRGVDWNHRVSLPRSPSRSLALIIIMCR